MVVILVGGPSAIGKDRLIGQLAVEEATRKRLGIPSNATWLTATNGGALKNWKEWIKDAFVAAPSITAVLKWQASIRRSSVEWICTECPGTEVRGIFLWLDENKHIERFLHKHQGAMRPPTEPKQ